VEKGRRGRSSLALRVDSAPRPCKKIEEMSGISSGTGNAGTAVCSVLLSAMMSVCSRGKFDARGVAIGEDASIAICPSSIQLTRVRNHDKSPRKRSDVPSSGWAYGQSSPSGQSPSLKRLQTSPRELNQRAQNKHRQSIRTLSTHHDATANDSPCYGDYISLAVLGV
jgi:hypothetical protein